MKAINLIVLLAIMLLSSCEKESSDPIVPSLLTGEWRLQSVTFNDTEVEGLNDRIRGNTILCINGNSNTFFRNYISGDWTLENNLLVLEPLTELGVPVYEYEILELTSNLLKVQISLTESDYCCDFDEFESDEVLVITEEYKKAE